MYSGCYRSGGTMKTGPPDFAQKKHPLEVKTRGGARKRSALALGRHHLLVELNQTQHILPHEPADGPAAVDGHGDRSIGL